MRIVIADYSGHPFQVQLSRELARRGHSVLHLYFSEFQTPKGRLKRSDDDPQALEIEAIALGAPFEKHNFVKRRFQEVKVGRKFANRISNFEPNIVVASNLPLDALRQVQKSAAAEGRAFVFWQQDIYSVAIDRILRAKMGTLGAAIGKLYRTIERNALRSSQAIVTISEDFLPYLKAEFGTSDDQLYVVENWAPLDEITPQPKDNSWARENNLHDKEVVLYTGTLGMKHDPDQILYLARSLSDRPRTEVVVVSEGPAAAWLSQRAAEENLSSLRVLAFQPYEQYSQVLGSADIVLAILEPEAGTFSVPSKVLSYLSAGRAIVLSAPLENLASRIVSKSGAGTVVAAGERLLLQQEVKKMLDCKLSRDDAARKGRRYAEHTFDIGLIGNRFEGILMRAHGAQQLPMREHAVGVAGTDITFGSSAR